MPHNLPSVLWALKSLRLHAEGDIKGVIDTPFTYINLYNKVSYTQEQMMLKSAVYSRKIAI